MIIWSHFIIYVSFHFLSICQLRDDRTIAFVQLWSVSDLRTISPWATRGKKHRTLAEVGLGQNSLTVFCIRHHRLLVSGGRFSVSSDGSPWHLDTRQSERSSSRRIRSNDRRVSDLGDLDEISSSYADGISDRSALRCAAGGVARYIANKDRRRDRVYIVLFGLPKKEKIDLLI